MAEERVRMRLEILNKEAETNPNMETATLTFIAVAEKGNYSFMYTVIFVTARIQCTGEGNVFTGVCHSVHGGSASSQHA